MEIGCLCPSISPIVINKQTKQLIRSNLHYQHYAVIVYQETHPEYHLIFYIAIARDYSAYLTENIDQESEDDVRLAGLYVCPPFNYHHRSFVLF
ncbi:11765_t:CDS:2 [Ambispora gerdemannii]|uniref:11765_t:CDS:1 n=1 Tax=Ambispora gerdemannii TaxID=144530 RepID=A0A9N9BNW8_9GLOM|nr:11765_t:CDS:2 [Ambispora gerdemannii]